MRVFGCHLREGVAHAIANFKHHRCLAAKHFSKIHLPHIAAYTTLSPTALNGPALPSGQAPRTQSKAAHDAQTLARLWLWVPLQNRTHSTAPAKTQRALHASHTSNPNRA